MHLLAAYFFENPASIMACGTRMTVVVSLICMAASTFFSCMASFFGMLEIGLYSVVTLLNMKLSAMMMQCFMQWFVIYQLARCELGGLVWHNFGGQDDV